MTTTTPVSGPHTHAPGGVTSQMGWVILALLPATAFGVYLFGWPALNLLLITVLAAIAFEVMSLRIAQRPVTPFLMDGSALLTGLLLALTLPPWAPWWIAVLGAGFAIVVGKHVFGGLGQNLFNPAMLARVALLVSFPLEMTTWVTPQPMFAEGSPGFIEGLAITFGLAAIPDAMTGATVLGETQTGFSRDLGLSETLPGVYDPMQQALGFIPASMGEGSALLLLAGGLLLMVRRIISWEIPVSMLGTLAALATIFMLIDPERFAGPGLHLISGGAMLAAFFIATDPVTSPSTMRGRLIFGVGCGLLIYVIRTWGGYPEGIAFAIILMNGLAPLIDHYLRPRTYGRTRGGKPLEPKAPAQTAPVTEKRP
ncbi:RnfABCDGE type electron transport complex subunit D [Ectothiorhodospira marina]|uniref:Ion-translocating oxidoreductase complex subunit D n=1 Tax=Ectothiorhodospira marina TaxID=1396821 RepID=A0A1H7MXG1_9GAMM|nr:RnfABCDGE type electron transport complex subunit D [Ectothiorhodospira marina]SEL15884.1 electron transport complex protein RnfD [Ectothiorhodospira marina]